MLSGEMPNIPGLNDNVSSVTGAKVGSNLAYIRDKNSDFGFFDSIGSLVFNQYSAPCYGVAVGNEKGVGSYSQGNDFFKELVGYSRSVIRCMGSGNIAHGNYKQTYWGPVKHRNNNNNTEYTQQGDGRSYLQQLRPIIESESSEHYIAVPYIQASNEASQLINADFRTYVSTYANDYPYIKQISMGYYFKADVLSTQITAIQLAFALMPRFTRVAGDWLYSDPSSAGSCHYVLKNSGKDLIDTFGPIIMKSPNITYTIVDGTRYSCSLNDYTAMHASYALYPGDVTKGYIPFLYVTLDGAIEIINSLGMCWAENTTLAQTEAMGEYTTSDYVHFPKITNDGATTTEDFHGSDIAANWNNAFYRSHGGSFINININPYTPSPSPGGQDPEPLPPSSTTLNLDTPSYTGVGCFATYYSMSKDMINVLNNELWTSDDDTITAIIEGLKFYGTDPMQAIMSLRLYPFDVNSYVAHGSTQKIKLGRFEMQYASGYVLSDNATCILNLGSMKILPSFGDFRDYAPYTDIQLYVPYVGFIKLNTNEFMNRKCDIQMVVDLTTGSCEVCIYADNRPMAYQGGNIGVEIPITLNTMTDTATSIMQGILEFGSKTLLEGAEVALAVGTAKPSRGHNGRIKMGYKDSDLPQMDDYELDVGEAADTMAKVVVGASTTAQSGKASPACNLSNPLYPYLIISRPTWERPENYDHTYGKVCHTSGTLASFNGFTICRNVDTTGISCTKLEQNIIKSLLESGVYL